MVCVVVGVVVMVGRRGGVVGGTRVVEGVVGVISVIVVVVFAIVVLVLVISPYLDALLLHVLHRLRGGVLEAGVQQRAPPLQAARHAGPGVAQRVAAQPHAGQGLQHGGREGFLLVDLLVDEVQPGVERVTNLYLI
jgi:hypothetical protein